MAYDIHNYDRELEKGRDAVKKASISERNKEIIFEFEKYLIVRNISKPRIIKYLGELRRTAIKLGKDLDKANKQDIIDLVCDMQQGSYTEWTKKTNKAVLKRFYKWLKGGDKRYPEEVEWIDTHMPRSKRTLPKTEDLLTQGDISKLIEAANNLRDRALIAMLWESGGRIGEIGNQEVGGISFDKYGGVVTLNGKTGPRAVRLINSASYLANWLSIHPKRDDKHAPLWVSIGNNNRNRFISYGMILQMLKKLFKKVGIKKRFNPHIFRHSRATFLANHLTEFQMNQYFGWVQGSDMPSTYVHLSGKETDTALLKLNGIEVNENKEEQTQKPRICKRCDTINPALNKFCCKCGAVLDVKSAMEMEAKFKEQIDARNKTDNIMNNLIKDPEVQEFLARKLEQYNREKNTGSLSNAT